MINMFENSFYALRKKMLTHSFTPSLSISLQKSADAITLKIRDNGCGIEPEFINKVCEPFFTTKPPGQGTGLGLSLASDVIKEHRGTLTINSVVNEFTEISILFSGV